MFFEKVMNDGRKIRIGFLNHHTARIQICPAERRNADSALNRYQFIREPAEDIAVKTAESAESFTAASPVFEVECALSSGLISARRADGKPLVRMNHLNFSERNAEAGFQALPEEDWVGFGDQTRSRIYHRGHRAVCWVSNVASYLPVPFFMSTHGYGILVNTTHPITFDMCQTTPDAYRWNDERGVIDFYLFAAPTFKEMIALYTDLTGKPKLPPEWSFGLWYICRTQANDAEVMNDAVNFRREGIPCDLIGLEPGWMETDYDQTTEKNWSKTRFPLPDWQKKGQYTFIKALQRMGYHLELWLCNDYDLSFEEERRILRKTESAQEKDAVFHKDAEQDMHFAMPIYMDKITKREEPWFEHLKKFVDWGADFFKQDGAYQVCTHPDRLYGNGMVDLEMHNLYPLCYARQMWEGFAEYTNRRPVVFTVSGWTGFQSWCGTWTGDTGGRLETLGAMLNTAMMGHCWATNDMEVMQKEGIHFGYLQPWSQINSWTYFRMPWTQGDSLLEFHKYYSRLRSRLIPYIYSWARSATLTSVPLMLPLNIEFQEDLQCRTILHEYLLGRDLLVSIYKKEVYFPRGRWKDFWSGEVFEGEQTREIAWPENRGGGLFVREGAIIPFGPLMQYRKERPLDEIDLYLFPADGTSSFELYEDDGVTFEYLQGNYSITAIAMRKERKEITVEIGASPDGTPRRWNLTVALSRPPAEIRNNGILVSAEKIHWDGARQELKIENVLPGEIILVNG